MPGLDPALDLTLEASGPSGAKDKLGKTPAAGLLTELKGDELGRRLVKLWTDQNRLYKRRMQEWRVHRARRAGYTGVFLIKRPDTQEWIAWTPPGTSKQVPALNKAARQCRMVRAMMFVDPPEPEATPAKDTDEARDAAEFSTRVLVDLSGEANLDDESEAAEAFDLGSTYGSGYRRFYVEPNGAEEPLSVLALPTVEQVVPGDPQSPMRDPQTGEVSEAGPFVLKYVRQDFTLTDNPDDPLVQRQQLPVVDSEVLPATQVRLIPATARDVWEADGAIVAAYVPVGELKRRVPGKLPEDPKELRKLVTTFPELTDDLLPGGKYTRQALESSEPSDSSLVFTVTVYLRKSPDYPQGFYGLAAGDAEDGILLAQDVWYDQKNRDALDLPLTQYKQYFEEGNPHGHGMMAVLGPGNEIRNAQLGGMLEHLDRFLNRKVFYPTNSNLQPRVMQAITGTYVPITPGGKPEMEQVPDFPSATLDMFKLMSDEMEHESGIEAPATGENPSSVQSGLHARTIIEQVNVGLSELRNNTIRASTRGWRIVLQLIRAHYDTPRRIRWVGEDGAYKEKLWSRVDLGSTRDVQLHKGTLSMLSPSAKTAVAEQMFAMRDPQTGEGLLDLPELRRIVVGGTGGLLGLQDDPHRQRIRRQIDAWAAGPPRGWTAPLPQKQPGPPDPATGQPTVQQVQPPDPVSTAIFAPTPADVEPLVAKTRHFELQRLIATQRYGRWPPAWRAAVDAEYQRMRQAAGIVTVAEQQQAAQQQQQQQQAQAQQQLQMQLQAKAQEAEIQKGMETHKAGLAQQQAEHGAQLQAQVPPAPTPADPAILQQLAQQGQGIAGVQQLVQQLAAQVQGLGQATQLQQPMQVTVPVQIVKGGGEVQAQRDPATGTWTVRSVPEIPPS